MKMPSLNVKLLENLRKTFWVILALIGTSTIPTVFLFSSAVAAESCNPPVNQGAVYTVKIGEEITFNTANCSDIVNPVPLDPPILPVDQTSASVSGNVAEASASSRPGYRSGAQAIVGVRYKWDLNGRSWEDVKDIPVTVTALFSYRLKVKNVNPKPAGAVGAQIDIIPLHETWYKNIGGGNQIFDVDEEQVEEIVYKTTVGDLTTKVIFKANAYAGMFCNLELPDSCRPFEGYAPNEALSRIVMRSITIKFDTWKADISVAPLQYLGIPYKVALRATYQGSEEDAFEFGLGQVAPLEPLISGFYWPYEDRGNVTSCNFSYGFSQAFDPVAYVLLPNEPIVARSGETKYLVCTVYHKWNWVPPADISDIVAELSNASIFEFLKLLVGNFSEIISNILDLKELLDAFVNAGISSERDVTYSVHGEATDVEQIKVTIPETKFLLYVSSVYGSTTASAEIGGGIALCVINLPSCAGIILGGITQGVAAVNQRIAANDPRDDYTVVSSEEMKRVQALENIVAKDERDFAFKSIRLAALSEALQLSYARYLGALEADQLMWVAVQYAAMHAHLNEMQQVSREQGILYKNLTDELPLPAGVTFEDVKNYLRVNGLTPPGVEVLDAFGISRDEQSNLIEALLLFETNDYLEAFENTRGWTELLPKFYERLRESVGPLPEGSISAVINMNPKRLVDGSPGESVNAFIELPVEYDAAAIDVDSVLLNGELALKVGSATMGDHDGDGLVDLSVAFDGYRLQEILERHEASEHIILSVSGLLLDGTAWGGVDTIQFVRDDDDDDDIPNNEDSCPHSNRNETAVIGNCDSGVSNTLFDEGCTISDLIAECADGAKNHGKFVSCVAKLTNGLKKDGIITGQEKGAIQSCAAQASIP